MHCEYRNPRAPDSAAYLLPELGGVVSCCGAGAAVLDLGCGNGALTSMLAQPGWRVTGIDSSHSGIRIAREIYPQFQFLERDVTGPLDGLDPGSFDAVFCIEVIEHVPAPRQLARNAYRLLRPGGLAVFTTPYHGYLKNLVLAATGRLEAHFTALWDGGHIKFWSRATLESVLAEAGFSGLAFHGAGRLPYLWKSMVITAVKPS
jgi:2-polyprenyl-6-hydroxyphenyl methylase/3-demethylubiquinone-9 3-methyltransferase